MSVAEARSSPAAGAARFDRTNPSPRYRELLALFERVHREGAPEQRVPPEQVFPGTNVFQHLKAVRDLVVATGARTILDYGCGKGEQYRPQPVLVDGRKVADGVAEYWDVDEVRCFDPGFAPHAASPAGRFDGVLCVNVLEHCPAQDLDWIVDELFGYAREFVFAGVACFPALKALPDGTNAHATVQASERWEILFRVAAARYPDVRWELHCVEQPGSAAKVYRGGLDQAGAAVAAAPTVSFDLDGKTIRIGAPAGHPDAQALLAAERVALDWLRSMPENSVFVDVGAGAGIATLVAVILYEARAWTFEAEAGAFAQLCANLSLNSLGPRVLAHCALLSDHAGIERLGESQACARVRLDDLVRDGQVPQPRFMRVSAAQGGTPALRGMQETLRNAQLRSVLVELDTRLPEHVAARAWLEQLGLGWDRAQVMRAVATEGDREGTAWHVFSR